MSQVIIVAAGATLFVVGLMVLVGVDVGAGALDISGSDAGYEFSTALAVASIVVGAATTSIVLGAVLAVRAGSAGPDGVVATRRSRRAGPLEHREQQPEYT